MVEKRSYKSRIIENRNLLIIAFLILLSVSFIFSFAYTPFLDRNVYSDVNSFMTSPIPFSKGLYNYWRANVGIHTMGIFRWYRIAVVFPVFCFLGLHFIFPIKNLYKNIFKYRWLIGLFVLIYFMINRFHGDSLYMYDIFGMQSGRGSSLIRPVYGVPRALRTDEYLVDNARLLHDMLQGKPYGDMGIISYVINPVAIVGTLIFKLFGMEFFYSFNWYIYRIFGFLISIEFFMLLTKGKKLVSVSAAMMVNLSTFFTWWGLPTHFIWSQAAIVCFYHFFSEKEHWRKIVFMVFTGYSALYFIKNFYPAWQVPLAYVSLVLVIWVVIENWENIKNMHKIYFVLIGVAVLMTICAVALYLYMSRDYIKSITGTVYPGKRFDKGGDVFNEFFKFLPSTFYSYKDTANNSEFSSFINFFPIPLLVLLVEMIRKKKVEFLTIGLFIVSVFLFFYCWTGYPAWLAKITLMSFSFARRSSDVFGYIMVLFFAIGFGRYKSEDLEKDKGRTLPLTINIIMNILLFAVCIYIACLGVKISSQVVGETYYADIERKLLVPLLFGTIYYLMLRRLNIRVYYILNIIIIALAFWTGAYTRPISVGLDSVYSKPVAVFIKEQNQENPGKWISYSSTVLQSYATSCGVDALNYVNVTPNMELWHKLDPEHKYENVYNRYAHVVFYFDEETHFELNFPDTFSIYVAPEDFHYLDVKYIFSLVEINEDNDYFTLKDIYSDTGVYIYEVVFK